MISTGRSRRIASGTIGHRRIHQFLHQLCKRISQVAHCSLQFLKIENGQNYILHRLHIDTNKANVVVVVLESFVFFLEPATGAVQLRSCADEGDGNVVLSGQALGQEDNRTNVDLCRKWEDYHMSSKWDQFPIDHHVDSQLLLPPSTLYSRVSFWRLQ